MASLAPESVSRLEDLAVPSLSESAECIEPPGLGEREPVVDVGVLPFCMSLYFLSS